VHEWRRCAQVTQKDRSACPQSSRRERKIDRKKGERKEVDNEKARREFLKKRQWRRKLLIDASPHVPIWVHG